MNNGTLYLVAVVTLAWLAVWPFRVRLVALVRNPTPGFLKVCRLVGGVARAVCGIGCLILVWAGLFGAGVSWLYAVLGVVAFGLNILLCLDLRRPD